MIKKLIVGSPEAMQHEPSLEPPEARCDTSVEIGDYIDTLVGIESQFVRVAKRIAMREKRLEDSLTEPPEDDVFPKGIDDSIGG
tara:strand:- start:55 stop:306 length:252 start_codon:yes stop_codon:yes gene_type:complete